MCTLSTDQENAVDAFLYFMDNPEMNEMAITGAAGTGKTFLTKYLLTDGLDRLKFNRFISDDSKEENIFITATTNQAASVIEQLTGKPATTIHSLLNLTVKNDYQTGETRLIQGADVEYIESLIIIDEASMIDSRLLYYIRKSCNNCKVIFIGDKYQLPPVNEHECPVFEEVQLVVELKEIQRQAKHNPIIQLAHSFREVLDTRKFPKIISDNQHIYTLDGDGFKQEIINAFTNTNSIDSKVLSWTNDRVDQYNKFIRKLHTTSEHFQVGEYVVTNKPVMSSNSVIMKTNRIAQIKDISPATFKNIDGFLVKLSKESGAISAFIPRDPKEVKRALSKFKKEKNWKEFFILNDYVADLRPLHSCTIHKSQGSTYKNVFIDLHDIGSNSKWYEVAKLIYVAVTRASDKVYFYGELPDLYKG